MLSLVSPVAAFQFVSLGILRPHFPKIILILLTIFFQSPKSPFVCNFPAVAKHCIVPLFEAKLLLALSHSQFEPIRMHYNDE